MSTDNETPAPAHCGRPMRQSYEQRDKWWCSTCDARVAKDAPSGGVAGGGSGPSSGAYASSPGVAAHGAQGGAGGYASTGPARTPRTASETLAELYYLGSNWRDLLDQLGYGSMRDPDALLVSLRRLVPPHLNRMIDRIAAGGYP
jgi:hypothetical protein